MIKLAGLLGTMPQETWHPLKGQAYCQTRSLYQSQLREVSTHVIRETTKERALNTEEGNCFSFQASYDSSNYNNFTSEKKLSSAPILWRDFWFLFVILFRLRQWCHYCLVDLIELKRKWSIVKPKNIEEDMKNYSFPWISKQNARYCWWNLKCCDWRWTNFQIKGAWTGTSSPSCSKVSFNHSSLNKLS